MPNSLSFQGCKLQEAVVCPKHSFLLLRVSFGPLLQEYRVFPEVRFPLTEESNTGDHRNTTRPLILFAAQWSVSPIAPAFKYTFIHKLD